MSSNVSGRYVDPEVTAITLSDDQRLDLSRGSVLIVTGANNSGKTTFLNEFYAQLGRTQNGEIPAKIVTRVDLDWNVNPDEKIAYIKRNYVHKIRNGTNSYLLPRKLLSDYKLQLSSKLENSFGDMISAFIKFDDAIGRVGESVFKEKTDAVYSESQDSPHPIEEIVRSPEDFRVLEESFREIFFQEITLDDFGRQVGYRLGEVDDKGASRTGPVDSELLSNVRSLPAIQDQGLGMRATLGILIAILGGKQEILLVDEPEAFLHPPQAKKLASVLTRLAVERKKTLLVATHDRNYINGILDVDHGQVSFLRLNRVEHDLDINIVDMGLIESAKAGSLVRYSPLLDTLFHKLTIVVEGESDAIFFSAAFSHMLEDSPSELQISPSDILILPCGGKAAQSIVLDLVRKMGSKAAVICDFDIFSDDGQFRSIWEAAGNNWSGVNEQYRSFSNFVDENSLAPESAELILSLKEVVDSISADSGIHNSQIKKQVSDVISFPSPWKAYKSHGVEAVVGEFPYEGIDDLLGLCLEKGIAINPYGELESFARFKQGFECKKNSNWPKFAIEKDLHKLNEVQQFLSRVLCHLSK
ncbi:ATP-dependent nuclease [Corynebacterium sputi]|uniref:ATP-dependent nuclease n=1 Tax=Corynebacterium sputi TaxID=489915 RepID=UPI0004051AE9|nr:AAA family ATPase [Corynebacterium sputi]